MIKVDIYRNLHKDCYSIRSRNPSDYGRVIGHTKLAVVVNATFPVRSKGRDLVRKTKRKNVHAFVRGDLSECAAPVLIQNRKPVTYNPYTHDGFMCNGQIVTQADAVILKQDGMWAVNPR